ncbi:MAG: hypothetical protein IT378_19360 [Sandaracinaceae bacterium]|nr:hypothetical protein [Sandaracinaceae bacterium]
MILLDTQRSGSLSLLLLVTSLAGGCALGGGGDGTGRYPLAGADLCPTDLTDDARCDPSALDARCALASDLDVACRCAPADDGAAVVRCDVPSPVPPLPPLCSADVAPGSACDPRLASRVCSLPEGRCVCANSNTDPSIESWTWVCEAPAAYCPRDAAQGSVCAGHEGTSCELASGGRCRCADDPLRDGLTTWECEVPPPPPACDLTAGAVLDGQRCDVAGQQCNLEGLGCVCAHAVDGARDTLEWQCDRAPASVCSDAVRAGERVACDAIGETCGADGLICRCVEDPSVPAELGHRGAWLCESLPPPPSSECGADIGTGLACPAIGASCSLGGGACTCREDARVPPAEGGTWLCDGPPAPLYCAADVASGVACRAIGESCAQEDGTACRCVEDASVPALASGVWLCEGARDAARD